MKNSDRIQTIGVLLLAVFAWLAVDLGTVKHAVVSFLETGATAASDEATAGPGPEGPALLGHPAARPALATQRRADPQATAPIAIVLPEPPAPCKTAEPALGAPLVAADGRLESVVRP